MLHTRSRDRDRKPSRRLAGTRWALAEILVLEASTLDLTRRASRTDAPAAAMLVPDAGWFAFATALNAAIAGRNPAGQH